VRAAGIFGWSTPLWLKLRAHCLRARRPVLWRQFVAPLRGRIPRLRENMGEPGRWIGIV